MQAVILAASIGEEMYPLTRHIPKAMVRVSGRNLIEHNLDVLPKEVDEIIIVVGYLSEQIENHFGEVFEGRKVTYVKQKKKLGTGHALFLCQKFLKKRFIVMMADDLYSKEDVECAIKEKENIILVKKIHGKFKGGKIITDKNKNFIEIKEGSHNGKSSYVNTAFYVLNKDIFKYDLVLIKDKKEYGLPQTIVSMAKDIKVKVLESKGWFRVEDLQDLKGVKRIVKKRYKNK